MHFNNDGNGTNEIDHSQGSNSSGHVTPKKDESSSSIHGSPDSFDGGVNN